jgi:Tol biopolymer transport system component
MPHGGILGLCATVALVLTAVSVQPARGALPGVNGSVAFTDPNQGILVMGANGENPTIVSGDTDDSSPSFSPDGSKIVFVNTRFPIAPGELEEFPSGLPGTNGLYVMDANGENRRRVLNPGDDPVEDPVFSPDGSRIAFIRDVGDTVDSPELHVINLDGSNERVLTQKRPVAGTTESDANPAWSPDGSRIAFERSTLARTGIWTIGADGQVETQLTSQWANPGQARDSGPDWSPNGSRIAFRAQAQGENGDIHVMDADGRNRTRLTSDPLDEGDPAFSPDGSRIAFTRAEPPPPPEPDDPPGETWSDSSGDVWVMAASGAGQHNLTNTLEGIELGPAWQPRPPTTAGTPVARDKEPPVISHVAIVPTRFAVGARPTPPDGVAAQRRPRRGATIRYRLSESASAKLGIERIGRGIRVTRQRHTSCVRLTARTRREALAVIGRRLGARARGRAGRRRVARALRRARCSIGRPVGSLARRSRRGLHRVVFTGRVGRTKLAPGSYRIRVGAVDAAGNPARQRLTRTFRIVR